MAAITSNVTTGDWSAAGTWAAIAGTGTITTATTSTALTGSGTAFTTELAVGSIILVGGVLVGTIATITDNTNAVFAANAASDNTGAAFTLKRVPINNDSVTIATGHTITFDVTQSGMTDGIDGITITGTLKLSRSTSGYMKIKVAKTITGAGTFDCGASALDAIPFAVKHVITGGAGWYINGASGLTMTVYAAEPAIKTILLSGDEAIGQTELSVGTSVVGDIWADGDTIRIDDINQAKESEERTIAAGGIAAGTITITAGLTDAKSTGAVISLVTRNVKITGVGGSICKNFTANKVTVAGGSWTSDTRHVFDTCAGVTISGGAFSGDSYVLIFSNNAVITGGVFTGSNYLVGTSVGSSISNCYVSGLDAALYRAYGITVSGGTFKGLGQVFNECGGATISGGTFSGNGTGLYQCSGIVKNASFSSNTQDIYASVITSFNTLFNSNVENNLYTINSKESYSESFDHDQQAGAFRAWTNGGVTTKQAVTYPSGKSYSMQTVFESATKYGWWQREITVGAGASVNITSHLRKTVSMAYLPRVIIFNKATADPWAGGTGLDTFTMTDSTDTWESDVYTYTNSTSEDVTLVIRAQGKNASGSMYSLLEVEQINVDMTTALANIATVDGIVDAIKLKTDNLPTDPADQSLLLTAIQSVDTDVLDAVVEGTYTVQDVLKIMVGVLAGKASGGGTTAITFRDLSDSLDRVKATVDSSGNRTAVTLNDG